MIAKWCRTASYAPHNRPGVTLVEVMFVTMIIGVLVMVVAGPVGSARERAMVSAVKSDMRNVEDAIDRYILTTMELPASLDDLDEEYEPASEVLYCRFTPTPAADLKSSTIELAGMHRSSVTVVSTIYPSEGGRFTETPLKKVACPSPKKKLVKVKKK
jgi:prepilin-type N-terminal cleavage/methylation domain-containing protein